MTATAAPPGTLDIETGEERGDRLAVAASRLRTRKGFSIDRGFQVIGGVLLSVGVLAIIAGAYGVSHTARLWRQTPYVVSGGILGVGLIIIGGFAYLAFWLTTLVEATRRQTDVLERIDDRLRRQAGEGPELL
jgi:hypothetical protein